MRQFIIISNTVDTSKPLSLNSLTGYGRLDVICRCINSAFFLSNEFRKNVILKIFFRKNGIVLEIQGEKVRGINPDERAIAGVLKKIFKGHSYEGIRFYQDTLDNIVKEEKPAMMESRGIYSTQMVKTKEVFLIGDQLGFPEEEDHLFSNLEKLSLGVNEYLSSQTITIINYLLDCV
jgi:tRNA (pseudouridine54-N1)-methyltransferase